MAGFHFVTSWTPTLLVQAGLSATEGITGGTLVNVGGMFGAALLGLLAARFALRNVLIGHLLGTAVLLGLFISATSPLALAPRRRRRRRPVRQRLCRRLLRARPDRLRPRGAHHGSGHGAGHRPDRLDRLPRPQNQWYVAAYGREIGRELFSRTVCGESILFWRHGRAGHGHVRPLRAPPLPALAGPEPARRRHRGRRPPRLHLRRRRRLRGRARPDPRVPPGRAPTRSSSRTRSSGSGSASPTGPTPPHPARAVARLPRLHRRLGDGAARGPLRAAGGQPGPPGRCTSSGSSRRRSASPC
jgi:hypothetical protein